MNETIKHRRIVSKPNMHNFNDDLISCKIVRTKLILSYTCIYYIHYSNNNTNNKTFFSRHSVIRPNVHINNLFFLNIFNFRQETHNGFLL